ncbi:MAG TPA: nucleotidyltransferase family protein [Thermomicrobiaceae bacterium]|nr:nucleotidyltransferase family protein [Thermomicrobiaceae bacterium]
MSESASSQPARTVDDFIAILKDQLPSLQRRYHVRSLGIFGSYVRGEQRPGSDLDVLVEFSETPGLLKYIALRNELSDLLGVPVDLVKRGSPRPRVGQRIEQEVIPV